MNPYYEHNGITIYHGDCRDVLSLGFSAQACVTDPPYGMKDKSERASRVSSTQLLHCAAGLAAKDWNRIHGDDQPFNPAPWVTMAKCVLFGAVHYSSRLPESRAWLVWDKRDGTTPDDNADCDFAWTNLRGPARLYRQLWRGVCREGAENAEELQHPHQKPIALMKWVILQCKLSEGETVLDPYMGSGTTLSAAKQLGLKAIGIEIEEKYCEIAAKRLAQEVIKFG